MRLDNAALMDMGRKAGPHNLGMNGQRIRMRFGEGLKVERERRGISLDDVSVSTRVSLRHLHALEADQFRELPGGVFNKGIVRSYAQYCGLDTEHTVQVFVEALRASGIETDPKEDDWVEFAEAVKRSRKVDENGRKLRWLGVVGMVVAVLILAAGVLWVLVHRGVVHLPQHRKVVAASAYGAGPGTHTSALNG